MSPYTNNRFNIMASNVSNTKNNLKRKIFELLENADRQNCSSMSSSLQLETSMYDISDTINNNIKKRNSIHKNKNVPLTIQDLKQVIEETSITAEEWQCGIKFANAIADHIMHNIFISKYYHDFNNIKNIISFISFVVSKYSFAHTQFLARMYFKHSKYGEKQAFDTTMEQENNNDASTDNSYVNNNNNNNNKEGLVPLLLAWGLHINSHINFKHFLLQNSHYVASSWAQTTEMINGNNNDKDLNKWFNSATLMFLNCCIGMHDDVNYNNKNAKGTTNNGSEKDLKNHCLNILHSMRIQNENDFKRGKLLRLLIQNATFLRKAKSKAWFQKFIRSTLFHILELPCSMDNFRSPSSDNIINDNANNNVENDKKEKNKKHIYYVLQDVIQLLPEESYIDTVKELLKLSVVGSNVHWTFLEYTTAIIKQTASYRPTFFDKVVLNLKIFCVECLKDCKATHLASALRFLQYLFISCKAYKTCLQSLFDTASGGTAAAGMGSGMNNNNKSRGMNSLKVQKSTSPKNQNMMMMMTAMGDTSEKDITLGTLNVNTGILENATLQQQISIDPSKRVFSTFLKSLELLVPSDSLEYLHVHKHIVLPHRSRYRSICGDLIGLINTRVDDLKSKSNNQYEIGSKRDNIAKDVVAYVDSFHKTGGNIPQALLQTALFRKQFFIKEFLPVLLSNTQTFISHGDFNFHDERKKMVCQLSDKSLIPPSIFEQFLKLHANNTQSSTSSSQRSNLALDTILSKLSNFAVIMSEYGEIATSAGTSNNTDNNNSRTKTTTIDYRLKRKKVKAWKEYLEKVAVELTKHQQDKEYIYTLIDAIGNSIAISFNSGYDYVSMQRWIRDVFNIIHQSQVMDLMKSIIKKWISSIDSKTSTFKILILATFVTHTMYLTKSYATWNLSILQMFMRNLLCYPKSKSKYGVYKSLVNRFYEYFYLCIVSHFDRMVISSDCKMTEMLLQKKYTDMKKEPFIISIFPFRIFHFLTIYNIVEENNNENNGKNNSTKHAIMSSIQSHIQEPDLLKFSIGEFFLLSCYFFNLNHGRNSNASLTTMSQFIWSKKYVLIKSINRLFIDLLKSCIFYKILKNMEPIQGQGENQTGNHSSKSMLLSKWQNKISPAWRNLKQSFDANVAIKWKTILDINNVNQYDTYRCFLLQIIESLSARGDNNIDENNTIASLFLQSMKELNQELSEDLSFNTINKSYDDARRWIRYLLITSLSIDDTDSYDTDGHINKKKKSSSGNILNGKNIKCLISQASIDILQTFPTKVIFQTKKNFQQYINIWFKNDVNYWPPNITFELARILNIITRNENGDMKLSDFPTAFVVSLIQHWNNLLSIPDIKSNSIFFEIELIFNWLKALYPEDGETHNESATKHLEQRINIILESKKEIIDYCVSEIKLMEY